MRYGEAMPDSANRERDLWYVIQTRTGYEHELVNNLKNVLDKDSFNECFVPMFEDVKNLNDGCRISYRRLFPGYVIIDTDKPGDVIPALSRVLEFTRFLGAEESKEDSDEMYFASVSDDDRKFLESILEHGVMSVSYVENVKGKKAGRIIGPLEKYGNRITKLEFGKRYAIVEAEIFGKRRKIKFGLWTDKDQKIPWIEERRNSNAGTEYLLEGMDIGIHPGDKVRDISGMYDKDEVFIVRSVKPYQRKFVTEVWMFGEIRRTELFVDQVEKIK